MERVIHRFWGGELAMPQEYREYGQMWQALNQGWVVKDWTWSDISVMQWINQPVMDHIRIHGGNSEIAHTADAARWTQFADVLGYELVWRFGGVYINCDMEPLRPLSHLGMSPHGAYACVEVPNLNYGPYAGRDAINNGFMAGPAFHTFFKSCIDILPERFFSSHRGQAMHLVTGPALISQMWYDNPSNLVVLPQNTFNYAPLTSIPVGGDAATFREGAFEAGAVALHHWGHKRRDMRIDG